MDRVKALLLSIWKAIIRIFAFFSKDIRRILHQPRLVFSLILGPFLILLIFGIGYRQDPRTLRTLFVVPESSKIEATIERFGQSIGDRITYEGIVREADEADRRLRQREVDLVVVAPLDPLEQWQNDEQSTISFYHYEIDPFEQAYIQVVGQRYTEEVNEQVLLTAVEQSQSQVQGWQTGIDEARDRLDEIEEATAAGNEERAKASAEEVRAWLDVFAVGVGTSTAIVRGMEEAGGQPGASSALEQELEEVNTQVDKLIETIDNEPTAVSETVNTVSDVDQSLARLDEMLLAFENRNPEVLVSPFQSETLSVTRVQVEGMHFYVPAVIALLLQHLAITLSGLSIIREKLGGAMELIRAAPSTGLEMLIGKYGGYFVLIGVLAVILTGLIVWILRMPQLGTWANYALVITALILASLGIGFNISLSARSDSQAIQYSMLTLLAAIFFSGFFLPLYRLAPAVRVVSWMLPATYATVMLKNVMLRGQSPEYLLLLVLFGFALVLFVLAWFRVRRQMARVRE